ncbi:MAG: hypothetical protein K0S08_1413 [Gammaproteobacteria bacterium]|jgi:hypothetical protein|nr:hypothetical protein [Gammaproteobacteria bacterium]
MALLQTWLFKQKQRQEKVKTLSQALLLNFPIAYAWYRLRYLLLNNGFRTILHLFEFYFLGLFFSTSQFVFLVLLRAATLFINNGWWGVLEVLRSSIRESYKARKIFDLQHTITCWSWLALLLLLVVLSGVSLLGFLTAYSVRGSTLMYWYMAAICFQLTSDTVIKTLHSGVYALQRIYRPFWAMVAAELLGFFVIMLLWHWQKPLCLPISYFFSSVLSLGLTWYFVHRAYKVLNFKLVSISLSDWWFFLKNQHYTLMILAGSSTALMGLEGILLWLLKPHAGHHESLFKVFYLIMPQVLAGFSWAKVNYFDFKKLSLRASFSIFRKSYFHKFFFISLLLGIWFWLTSSLLILFFMPNYISWTLFLLPMFLLRSILAYLQIKCFAIEKYWAIILSSLFFMPLFFKVHSTWEYHMQLLFFEALLAGAGIFCYFACQRYFRQADIFRPIYPALKHFLVQHAPAKIIQFRWNYHSNTRESRNFQQEGSLRKMLQYGAVTKFGGKVLLLLHKQVQEINWQESFLKVGAENLKDFYDTGWCSDNIKLLEMSRLLKPSYHFSLIQKNFNVEEAEKEVRAQCGEVYICLLKDFSALKGLISLPECAYHLANIIGQCWSRGYVKVCKNTYHCMLYWHPLEPKFFLVYVNEKNISLVQQWQHIFLRESMKNLTHAQDK